MAFDKMQSMFVVRKPKNDGDKQAVKIPAFCRGRTCELWSFIFCVDGFSPHAKKAKKCRGTATPLLSLARVINHWKFEKRETTEYLLHAKEFLACVNKERANFCVYICMRESLYRKLGL